jgi:hypothetical protein
MGGMHGFGKVEPEKDEPVFHAAWEGRCLALNRAMGAIGAWTIDEGRAGIETLRPDVYLALSYYGKWAMRLENMVVLRGLAGADEVARGHALCPAKPLPRYARGHVGTIEAIRGSHVFPDSTAIGGGENPQWLYTVVFDSRELWGEAADPTLNISIEAFEPYLEAA